MGKSKILKRAVWKSLIGELTLYHRDALQKAGDKTKDFEAFKYKIPFNQYLIVEHDPTAQFTTNSCWLYLAA